MFFPSNLFFSTDFDTLYIKKEKKNQNKDTSLLIPKKVYLMSWSAILKIQKKV